MSHTRAIVEIVAAATIPVALVVLLINRWLMEAGIGARAIQFVAVTILLPVVLILALEDKIDAQVTGTLLGGLAGYLLSGIGNYDISRLVDRLTNSKQEDSDD